MVASSTKLSVFGEDMLPVSIRVVPLFQGEKQDSLVSDHQ